MISAWPMCEPRLRTPGIESSSLAPLMLMRCISGQDVAGLVSQCIRKSRSLKSGSSDCPSIGQMMPPASTNAPTVA